MDWGGEQYQYGGGGCFLYCTLQRPCCDGGDGRNHSGGRRHVTGGDGSAPCVSPSVIGAIRTCRDIFDKLCTAADRQAGQPPASCACCHPAPPRYLRECCCCRDPPPRYQPPRSVRFSDDDATCTTCVTTTTDDEEEDENEDEDEAEVVQKKTEDKATATSEWTLHVQGGDVGAGGGQSIATSDLTNERELEVISETDTPHETHDYAAAARYTVEELEEEEVLHGGLLEPSVSGGYEIAFSEPEPFTTEQEQNGPEQPAPKPPEEPDQSKATTTVMKRVPCKHRKKKSKCCKCKNKNTQQRPADDKPRSLCQCAPIVIFDSPPAKRNFFDFLRGLLPRSKRTGAKTSAGKDQKVLCACGKEMQPFFGYADLEKRGSRDKKVHGKSAKKDKTEAPSEEGNRRPSKRVATPSDEIKTGTLEECRCAEADIKNTGAKSSRRSSKNKRQSEASNEADVTGSHRDSSRTSSNRSKSSKNDMSNHSSKHKQDGGRNRQGSHQSGERTSNCSCNLQEHWAKLKANGQQVPVKENPSKTANRKSSVEQPLKPSGISGNSKKPLHVVDVDDCEGSLCNLQDHWAKLKEQQVPVKESHNKIGHKSGNSKKEMHVVDFDENEGSLCNLQERWAKQVSGGRSSKVARILINTNKSSSGGSGGAKEDLRTVTYRRREQFGGFSSAQMSASYLLMFRATYTYRFQNEFRRYHLLFRERRFEDENSSRAIQTWVLKTETRHSQNHKEREDHSENKQMEPYTHPYDLKAIFLLFEEHKRQQPDYRDQERKALCRKLREKLSRKLSKQPRNEGLCVIFCFSYLGVYINVIVYIIIVIYSLLYVSMIR
ncbi:unnamed protein product [Callosobruchus maculatus]|uniref:Uncharacterized protein n=1 Tax=Callosobruchus maculatus TaxID=64391 RepID=A0A653BR26_CALMS|nr:unnamed protein product [Callosobruchus maculatus]